MRLVVRLWEVTGQATTAHLRLDRAHSRRQGRRPATWSKTAQGPLELRDGVIAVPIRGCGLATVRIEAAGEAK